MDPQHLPVTRSARYFTLGAPLGAAEELWIVLHGYGQLASRFLRDFTPLEDGRTLIVAPEALSRFYLETTLEGRHGQVVGASWLTREDRDADLADHLRYLDELVAHLVDASGSWRPRLSILGFSQGSVMAARWMAQSALRPARLVLWGTPLPRDVPAQQLVTRLGATPVVFTAGSRDPYAPPETIEASAEVLRDLGAAVRVRRFDGGHVIDPSALLDAADRAGAG
jgi:predicted esterase